MLFKTIIILGVLVLLNVFLLAFSCNKTNKHKSKVVKKHKGPKPIIVSQFRNIIMAKD